MLESVWTRSPAETFGIFFIGLALCEIFVARAAIRLGSDFPRRRPFLYGAAVGAGFAVALLAYFVGVTAFDGLEGSALGVAEKARIAAFPFALPLPADASAWLVGAALLAQNVVLGVPFGFIFQKSRLFA
ncbi:MAG: hypothetical protein HUK22_05565 [Thermoguttaceae bacterium]|nr:hypothetical protein [Thermoguttaceae bacterium]